MRFMKDPVRIARTISAVLRPDKRPKEVVVFGLDFRKCPADCFHFGHCHPVLAAFAHPPRPQSEDALRENLDALFVRSFGCCQVFTEPRRQLRFGYLSVSQREENLYRV